MLGRVLAWLATIVVGAAVGAASAWAAIEIGQSGFGVNYGGWSFNRAAGSVAAGPYSRAIIARYGLLALSSREAIYFTLTRDEHGRPLDESCIYDLRGGD